MKLPSQDRQVATTRSEHVLAFYGGLALLAVLIAAGRGDVDLYRLNQHAQALDHILSLLLGLGVGVLFVIGSRLAVRHFRWAQALHLEFRSILGEHTQREILLLALASSVGEEFLFRGALMPWLGIWPQAILFACLHIGPGRRFLPWTLSALLVGAGFAYLAHWSGDLGAPIAAHFAINYLNLKFIIGTDLPSPAETALLLPPGSGPASLEE